MFCQNFCTVSFVFCFVVSGMEQISVGSSVVQYVDVNGRTDVLFVLAALARPLKEKPLPNQRLFPLNLNENDEDDLEKGRDWAM